jgi:glutathione S-transferase
VHHRLVTLVFSHYNEKARWALEYCGVPFVEDAYMPGFSQLGVMVATRGRGGRSDAVSSRWSTPVLITRDGETLCDSTDIAQWASRQLGPGDGPLFPAPDVLPLVDELGRDLGPYTRIVTYWHAFRSETAMQTLAEANVGRAQALTYRAVAPLGRLMIRRGLGIDEARYHRAYDRVLDRAAWAESPYLCGDAFTAADLTFAALFAPVVLPPEYGVVLPTFDELQPDTRELVTKMRATRAGQFTLEMFRRYRRATAAAAVAG